MSDLYDDDILLWSERQGDLLRRIANGESVNERPDWANIIEEVESVGRSDLRAVESLLLQAFVHMLKAQAWPNSLSAPAWQSDALLFRAQARRAGSIRRCAAWPAGEHGRPAAATGVSDLSDDAGRTAWLKRHVA
ncbi:MAG TPA: DUF29 family protein [Acetobacteraceae bacterium]|nr:DUF29 family protein [Acetobacteraceae bacterium]